MIYIPWNAADLLSVCVADCPTELVNEIMQIRSSGMLFFNDAEEFLECAIDGTTVDVKTIELFDSQLSDHQIAALEYGSGSSFNNGAHLRHCAVLCGTLLTLRVWDRPADHRIHIV